MSNYTERDAYLDLIDLSPAFIDRVPETDYAAIAALLHISEEEAREEHGRMFRQYLASIGLSVEEVRERMAAARARRQG